MTPDATALLTLILAKLEGIEKTVTDLSDRVERLESSSPRHTPPKVEPPKAAKLPAFMGALAGLDEKKIPAEDKLAFATGYLSAKLGHPPDKLCLAVGPTDYADGYNLGKQVANQVVDLPDWDLTPNAN
jgi:hypothetical protein